MKYIPVNPISRHQYRIALDTLRISKMGARIMGGMTHEEARAIIAMHRKAKSKNP